MGLSDLLRENYWKKLLVTGITLTNLTSGCLPEGHPPVEPRDSSSDIRDTSADASTGCAEYTCYNDECIPFNWVCDGDKDCSKGEDEKNCTPAPLPDTHDSSSDSSTADTSNADLTDADSGLETSLIFYDGHIDTISDSSKVDLNFDSFSIKYDSFPDTETDSSDADSDQEIPLIFYDTPVDMDKDTPSVDLNLDSLLIQYDSLLDTQKDSADADSSLETYLTYYDTLIVSDSSKVDSGLETSLVSYDTLIIPTPDTSIVGLDLTDDSIAETQSCTPQTYFQDKDGDGFGDLNTFQDFCLPLEGWVLDHTDCNDTNSMVYPGALELCDNLDNQCLGDNETGEIDENLTLEQKCGFNNIGECTFSVEFSYCQDGIYTDWADCKAVLPSAEICDGKDNDCDKLIDNGGNQLCDDKLYCNGLEVCAGELGCQTGTEIDCSENNLDEITGCDYNPDDNLFTFDYFSGFISSCDESLDACTSGSYQTMTHACDLDFCGAECDQEDLCLSTPCDSLDGCYNGTYRDYQNVSNTCLEDCTCTAAACGPYQEIITDADGDGFDLQCEQDCDDFNSGIGPGLAELCDGKDNDCDGLTDEDLTLMLDDFNKPSGSLGSNLLGNNWANYGSLGQWKIIEDNYAQVTWSAGAGTNPSASSEIGHKDIFNVLTKFKLSEVNKVGGGAFQFGINCSGGSIEGNLDGFVASIAMNNSSTHSIRRQGVYIATGTQSILSGIDYLMRFSFDGTNIGLKLWEETAPEPGNYLISASTQDVNVSKSFISLYGDMDNEETGTTTIDYILEKGCLK